MVRIVRVDKRWRIILPKTLRERLAVKPGHNLVASYGKEAIVLKKPRASSDQDPLLWDLEHPLHVSKAKLKKIDLDMIEEEMWLP